MPVFKMLFVVLILTGFYTGKIFSQDSTIKAFKTLNVTDGLPQSFISDMVQDSAGFIWIGTRDGLARYDGRKFKIFRHVPGDTTTLFGNIITKLYLDKQQWLWVVYESGDIDVLNTTTETLLHISKNAAYRSAYSIIKGGYSLAQDGKGNVWINCIGGGFLICNKNSRYMRYYADSVVGLSKDAIGGLAEYNGNIILITATAFITVSSNVKIVNVDAISLAHPYVNDFSGSNKQDISGSIKDDIIYQYRNNIAVYNPKLKIFKLVPLPKANYPFIVCSKRDEKGNFIFYYDSTFFIYSGDKQLFCQKPVKEGLLLAPKSILPDRSGVLWLGGNGGGIKLYDLRLSHWLALPYKKTFPEEVLQNYAGVPAAEIQKSFLNNMLPYRLRWAQDNAGKTWLSMAGYEHNQQPKLCYYKDGHLHFPPWRYTDTQSTRHFNINAVAVSKSGKLWGMDYHFRPVYFDTSNYAATVYPPAASANTSQEYSVNSLLMDDEDTFWFSTVLDGLYCYNIKTGKSIHYTEMQGSIPTNQLLNMVEDPLHKEILWIGSMGGGLIKFNKITGKSRAFTTNNGLPNNTVYAVLDDAKGMLWCSTNKGIFSFNPETNFARSFTSQDGLPGDEFNRYHYLQLPDGRMAFGGVDGYTVFNPLTIAKDTFQPPVVLTNIRINNAPANAGNQTSPLQKAANSIAKITLPYNQNSLVFEFAALEYNTTEKLQYRYKLEEFNDSWIYAGNDNIATYTNIPPGHYTFTINVTNTAGEWSRHVKKLPVIIQPPYWQTWWFTALWILAAAGIIYMLVNSRIKTIRKEERQKAAFEKQASELEARALRAQMNPHFIFNSLNSIKALIQKDKKKEAVIYLTAFSKLIRNQLNNAQQAISLHEELETCRLYAQLEAMRFGSQIACEFRIEETIDTHSLMIPPLIFQPFIENAICHGILPKQAGTVTVSVSRENGQVICMIEDDGIGRDMAMRIKSQTSSTHESKGMELVKNRLHLYNVIHRNEGSIHIIDKKNADNTPAGTLVIVTFKQEI